MSVPTLGNFPNTIANLPDRPGLGPQQMKEALQQDLSLLWPYVQQLITAVNAITGFADLPLTVANGGTGATGKSGARTNLGITVGSTSPSDPSVPAGLAVGDIYIYIPAS